MNKTSRVRLLNLYPVEAIRAAWGMKGKKADMIEEIAEAYSDDEIIAFCHESHRLTKQRIFVLEHNEKQLANFSDPLLAGKEPDVVQRGAKRIEEFYLLPVSYTALVGPPFAPATEEFVWPVRVVVEAKHALVAFTILEKNITTYLPPGKQAFNVQKEYHEPDVVALLKAGNSIERADLNKGVKSLWASDRIDSIRLAYKATHSTKTDTMDATALLKRDDPEAYEHAMLAPLLKTVFKTLDADSKFPAQFTVDATAGELVLTRYENADEVDNVVRAILSAN